MLVLTRKPDEGILIGDNIKITIVRIGPNTVRIGIEAPKHMNIRREELEAVYQTLHAPDDGTDPDDYREITVMGQSLAMTGAAVLVEGDC